MYDVVLFDLDGTLLDSLELIVASYQHTLAHHGLPARTEAEILAGLGIPLTSQFDAWGYGGELGESLVAEYIEYNLARHDDLIHPYPGAVALVHELHGAGVPLGLVTSKRRRGGEMGLNALGLTGCFGAEVYGDEVTRPKPDAEPVLKALALLDAPASDRVAFIGDSTHDVESALAAGVTAVAVTWGAGASEDLAPASIVVDDAAALRRAIMG